MVFVIKNETVGGKTFFLLSSFLLLLSLIPGSLHAFIISCLLFFTLFTTLSVSVFSFISFLFLLFPCFICFLVISFCLFCYLFCFSPTVFGFMFFFSFFCFFSFYISSIPYLSLCFLAHLSVFFIPVPSFFSLSVQL